MDQYGKASNELFTQFLARAHQELPTATVATFSTLKYINAQAFEEFRTVWKAKFLGGFVVHSRAFDGLKGDFPIGFLVWNNAKPEPIKSIKTNVIDRFGYHIGTKEFVNIESGKLLTTWVPRPATNKTLAVPLKGAIEPATTTADLRGTKWSDEAIGWFNCAGNDLQQAAKLTMILSSGFGSGRGYFINKDNLSKVAVSFAVRRLIKPTWQNDRDQFLQPVAPLAETFKSDCLIWMLFNGSNLSAGADGLEWNGRTWSLTNHFIPFTEAEVGAKARFASDFMSKYLAGQKLSPEAQAVLDEGRKLWAQYHAARFPQKIREELKLDRPDAGWYQIRKALEANAGNAIVDFAPFKSAYAALGNKLRPMVYELGFLPE